VINLIKSQGLEGDSIVIGDFNSVVDATLDRFRNFQIKNVAHNDI